MNHDPLCPEMWLRDGQPCKFCDVIARVREDERNGPLNLRSYDAGYAAALQDAVEAVRLSPSADIELVERSQVIAEIEALGEGGK